MGTILKLIIKLQGNKVALMLLEVLGNITMKVLDFSYPIIKEAVVNAEQIGNYIKENINKSNEDLIKEIAEKYGYEVNSEEVDYIRNKTVCKGYGKYLVAYRLIKNRFEKEEKDFIPMVVNLLIELFANKLYSNK